ncbi:acyl-protein thioesterase 1-like [Ylistrum balloti]|uniref:acyl-protein thioesterase 1-like n=1 Tax=Ylistrum balloti TaxID=509963 RepID=UPI002905B599|nr:acyl-protein thioesterase 1-like [Ylistrum balloti]
MHQNKTTVSRKSSIKKLRFFGLISTVVLFIGVFLCYWCMGNSSSSSMATPIVIGPRAAHRATLIFLHGLGDTGHGWAQGFAQLNMSNIKCVCPTSQIRKVTLNGGMPMPSWFDIYGLDPEARQDEDGIKKASQELKDLIKEEAKSISTGKIFIGGFSQGGAVALYTALTSDCQLAGLVGLSTWLPLHGKFMGNQIEKSKYVKELKVFQGHGKVDPMVSHTYGQMTSKILADNAKSVNFKSYDNMGHSSCAQEMADIKEFLESIIPSE